MTVKKAQHLGYILPHSRLVSAYQEVGILIKWDVFCIYWLLLNVNAGKIADEKNGDVAVDQYHRYKVQIKTI